MILRVKRIKGDWRRNLERTSRDDLQVVSEGLRQQGRLLAVRLAFVTMPRGKDSAARKKLQSQIEADVSLVAQGWRRVIEKLDLETSEWGQRLVKLMRAGKWDAVRKMVEPTKLGGKMDFVGAPDKSRHQAARVNGRVRRPPSRGQVVTNEPRMRAYVKQAKDKAGIGKAGWVPGAMQLGGTRGIPAWVTRQRGHGSARDLSNRKNRPSVILINNVKYIKHILRDSSIREATLDQRRNYENYLRRQAKGRRKKI